MTQNALFKIIINNMKKISFNRTYFKFLKINNSFKYNNKI